MFRVSSAVVCDYVRKEMAGKFACLGVYPNGFMDIEDFSLPVFVSLYLDINSDLSTEVDAHFILEDRESNTVFANFLSRIKLEGFASPPLFTTYPMEIKARGPCNVHFSAIVGTQKIELVTLTLMQAATTALPLPS